MTVAAADGSEVVVPITIPESTTAVGRHDAIDAKVTENIIAAIWMLNGFMIAGLA